MVLTTRAAGERPGRPPKEDRMPESGLARWRPGAILRSACAFLVLTGLILALGCGGKEAAKSDEKGPKDNVPKRMPK